MEAFGEEIFAGIFGTKEALYTKARKMGTGELRRFAFAFRSTKLTSEWIWVEERQGPS